MENSQKAHYEAIHDAYSAHYYDASSMRYRAEFLYGPLFKDVDLNGKKVLELASGGGANTLEILKRYPTAKMAGCDISEAACKDFREKTGCPAFQVDLTRPMKIEETYDALVIFGGIHHCVQNLPVFLENARNLLNPGGYFLMVEPSNQCFLECIRKFWYKHDSCFEADSEAALNHQELLDLANASGKYFTSEEVKFFGGPAFYLIYNSMIFRIPLALKPFIAPPLMLCERLYNKLPGKKPFSSFLAKWRRTSVS